MHHCIQHHNQPTTTSISYNYSYLSFNIAVLFHLATSTPSPVMGRISFQITTSTTSGSNRKGTNSKSPAKTTTTLVRLSDFTCIQETHPYGVLPGGNHFLFQEQNQEQSTTIKKDHYLMMDYGNKYYHFVMVLHWITLYKHLDTFMLLDTNQNYGEI
jgi:hypothetical protein